MKALQIYAGSRAMQTLKLQGGLLPEQVAVIPGAAGGPKGLILGPLDQFHFGEWLPKSNQKIDLVGASIGTWRLAAACRDDSADALHAFSKAYIKQFVPVPKGKKLPSADAVSADFQANLQSFFQGKVATILQHPRFRLHILTSRGKNILHKESQFSMPLGYFAAYAANAVSRRSMGALLERVVFSSSDSSGVATLPFATTDYPTQQVRLSEANFFKAVEASCAIPFMLHAVAGIAGAPAGAYWDGGITDYHLHLTYQLPANAQTTSHAGAVVLYPHFQQQVVPGWLDKAWRRRHRYTAALQDVVLLCPSPDWIARLPNAKLPDRNDFAHYGNDLSSRVRVWSEAVAASQQLADEWAAWLHRPDFSQLQAL